MSLSFCKNNENTTKLNSSVCESDHDLDASIINLFQQK